MHHKPQDKGGRKSKKSSKEVVGLSGLLGALHEESKPRSNMFDAGMTESYTPPARLSTSSTSTHESDSGLEVIGENNTDVTTSPVVTPSNENKYFATLISNSESENAFQGDSPCIGNGHVTKDMNNNAGEEILEEKDSAEKKTKKKSRQLIKVNLKTRTKNFLSGKEYHL